MATLTVLQTSRELGRRRAYYWAHPTLSDFVIETVTPMVHRSVTAKDLEHDSRMALHWDWSTPKELEMSTESNSVEYLLMVCSTAGHFLTAVYSATTTSTGLSMAEGSDLVSHLVLQTRQRPRVP